MAAGDGPGHRAGVAAGVTSAGVAIVARPPTFITTFAMLGITGGIGLLLTAGSRPGFLAGYEVFGNGWVGPIPVPVIIMATVYLVLHDAHADASRAEDLRHRRLLAPRPCRPGSRGSER